MKYTVYFAELGCMHVQAVLTLDEIVHNVHSDPKTCCATALSLNYGLSARFHCETVTFSSQHEIRDENVF